MRTTSGREPSTKRNRRAASGPESGQIPLGPAVFTPDMVQAMSEAFDQAWTVMLATDGDATRNHVAADTRRRLALAIVNAARRGMRDRDQLIESALGNPFLLGWTGRSAIH